MSSSPPVPEISPLAQLARTSHRVVHLQVEGVSHADSLICPQPAGNCLNWVLGHLLAIDGKQLEVLGQQAVMPAGTLARYDRGTTPLVSADQALDFTSLVEAWDETAKRIQIGLAAFPASRLCDPAPMSPSNNPAETMLSLLTTIGFHQAYHAGQCGLLRRLVGKPGAIP